MNYRMLTVESFAKLVAAVTDKWKFCNPDETLPDKYRGEYTVLRARNAVPDATYAEYMSSRRFEFVWLNDVFYGLPIKTPYVDKYSWGMQAVKYTGWAMIQFEVCFKRMFRICKSVQLKPTKVVADFVELRDVVGNCVRYLVLKSNDVIVLDKNKVDPLLIELCTELFDKPKKDKTFKEAKCLLTDWLVDHDFIK